MATIQEVPGWQYNVLVWSQSNTLDLMELGMKRVPGDLGARIGFVLVGLPNLLFNGPDGCLNNAGRGDNALFLICEVRGRKLSIESVRFNVLKIGPERIMTNMLVSGSGVWHLSNKQDSCDQSKLKKGSRFPPVSGTTPPELV